MIWNEKEIYKTLEKIHEEFKAENKRLNEEILLLRKRTDILQEKDAPSAELKSRIEDLELWRGKIHKMAIDVSPVTGKEKLSKSGRRIFGGH